MCGGEVSPPTFPAALPLIAIPNPFIFPTYTPFIISPFPSYQYHSSTIVTFPSTKPPYPYCTSIPSVPRHFPPVDTIQQVFSISSTPIQTDSYTFEFPFIHPVSTRNRQEYPDILYTRRLRFIPHHNRMCFPSF